MHIKAFITSSYTRNRNSEMPSISKRQPSSRGRWGMRGGGETQRGAGRRGAGSGRRGGCELGRSVGVPATTINNGSSYTLIAPTTLIPRMLLIYR